jgi:hypothetical protein
MLPSRTCSFHIFHLIPLHVFLQRYLPISSSHAIHLIEAHSDRIHKESKSFDAKVYTRVKGASVHWFMQIACMRVEDAVARAFRSELTSLWSVCAR